MFARIGSGRRECPAGIGSGASRCASTGTIAGPRPSLIVVAGQIVKMEATHPTDRLRPGKRHRCVSVAKKLIASFQEKA